MLTGPLIDKSPISVELMYTKNMTVGSFVVNNKLVLPNRLMQRIEEQGLDIADISISVAREDDDLN